MYNALSGNGDELYGIEPASYYIKNLLLTLGLTFPMALLEIIIFTYEIAMSVLGFHQICAAWLYELTTILCVVLWMGTLFSRPHKVHMPISRIMVSAYSLVVVQEERFMYPIYPLMCLLSALTLHRLENICGALLKSIMPPTAENTLAEKMIKSKTSAADKSTGRKYE